MNYMYANEWNIFMFSSCIENCFGKRKWKK